MLVGGRSSVVPMTTTQPKTVTVFWSWQSDLAPDVTRHFVEDCLKRAAKRLGATSGFVVSVDRDTKGVGGTPNISETILSKIAAADVFVWDASIVSTQPRSAPNPNVLFELGFAAAALGWNRIIGVMNTEFGPPRELPFDLLHRRWPLQFELRPRPGVGDPGGDWPERAEARRALVEALARAIGDAVKSAPENLTRVDPDFLLAKRLWAKLSSRWMMNWIDRRESHPQFESSSYFEAIDDYRHTCRRVEMRYENAELREQHEKLLHALGKYSHDVGLVMQTTGGGEFQISTKAGFYRALTTREYDEAYDREVQIVYDCIDGVKAAWSDYVDALRSRYPMLVHSDDD